MKQPLIIFGLIAVAVIAGAEVAVIYTTISPHTADPTVYTTFFLSLAVFLTAFLTLIWYGIQRWLNRYARVSWGSSLRQATLFSTLLVLTLVFSSLNILNFWDVAPLALSAILIEFFFQADKTPLNTPRHDPTATT